MTATDDDPLGILTDSNDDDPLGILPKRESPARISTPPSDGLQLNNLRQLPLEIQNQAQQKAIGRGVENTSDFVREVANDPSQIPAAIAGAAMLPFQMAGRPLNAAVQDIGSTISGHPELGGNLHELFNGDTTSPDVKPLPFERNLADISKSNPVIATTGKIASGLVESAPMLAVMPQGALGKLVAAGFSADMFKNAVQASGRLGDEMGKPESERDHDKITSALSEIIQGATFSGLGGAHLGGKFLTEKLTPKTAAINALAKELAAEPSGSNQTSPAAQRRLGIRVGEDALDPFNRPGVQPLVDAALKEAGGGTILEPNQEPALMRLRRELNPTPLETPVSFTPKEDVGGGKLAERELLRPAEETMLGRTVSEHGLPAPSEPVGELQTVVKPNTPLRSTVEIISDKLKNKDLVSAVDELSKQPADIQRKAVDEVLGVGKKKVGLSAAERTIFNELWDKVYQESLQKGKPTTNPSEISSKLVDAEKPEGWTDERWSMFKKQRQQALDIQAERDANFKRDQEIINNPKNNPPIAPKSTKTSEGTYELQQIGATSGEWKTVQKYKTGDEAFKALPKGSGWRIKPPTETITPANDTAIGKNAAGEQLYQRKDGSVYRMQNGRPNFGGDLSNGGSLSVAEAPKVSRESILSTSPEKYFEMSQQWAKDAMAGKGEPVQIQAELAALRDPEISKWQEGYDKASAEAAKVKAEVKANPQSMGDPAVQKRFGGAAQKAQFFSEGLKVLTGTEPNARTLAALERENSLRQNKTHTIEEPVSHESIVAEVEKLNKEFPKGLPVKVVKSFNELPDHMHQTAYRQGARPELISGSVGEGVVHLVTDNISSVKEARQIWLHEQAGHFATDKILGPKLNKFMEAVHKSFENDDLMADTRSRYTNADAARLGREFVARLSENPNENPGAWNKIVAQFRSWLRDIGWVKEVTENDIRVLLNRAMESLKDKEAGKSPDEISLSLSKQVNEIDGVRPRPEDFLYESIFSKLAKTQPDRAAKGFVAIEGGKLRDAISKARKSAESIGFGSGFERFESPFYSIRKVDVSGVDQYTIHKRNSTTKSADEGSLSIKSAAEKANERYPEENKILPVQGRPDAASQPQGTVPKATTKPGLGVSPAAAAGNGPVGSGQQTGVGKGGAIKAPTLDDIYKIFEPAPKASPTLKERAINIAESFRTGLSSKFRPVNKLAEDIAKSYGRTSSKDIAGIMEQLKGSQGKGEADIYRFDRDVSNLVKGSEKDFNAYVFLRRSLDRLNQDAKDIATAQAGGTVNNLNRRAVGRYTINELTPKLQTLESKLGPERLADFQKAADRYQRYMDDALRLQVESGRMSPEVYSAIKEGNQFYAPFKVMKYIEESSRPEGSGRKIDTVADYTKAMKGIESEDFKLGDMLGAARQGILMSRVLADKNMAMRHVAELAAFDTNGTFIKKIAPGAEPPKGFEAVNVLENGEKVQYAVRPEVAEAIQLYGGNAGGVISRVLGAFSVPFKAGATALNLPFQVSNLLADVPRQALVSKYGIKSISDLVHYPMDFVHALYSSISGDMLGRDNKLFLDFLDSGVAGTTVQEYLTPDALKFQEPTTISKSKKLASSVINIIPEFAKAIEQTSKVLGVKRAMRFEGVTSGKELAKQIPEAITELRRFSGSPDFGRQGQWVEQARLNLLYMFLNARIQGAIADVGRLGGRDGASQAAQTWLKMGTAVGIPTAYLYYLNQRPEFKDDYDKRPLQEKQNYWLIPKDSFITNDDGEKMRDYWRIPKREISKWMANLTESGLNFAQKRDPKAATDFGMSMIQEISPVNIQGDNAQERLESVAASLNPLLKAPLELASGRDMYRHRSVIPDSMKNASPENQYTPRTAEAFKKLAVAMPDVAPEFLRSPLVLENLTRNLTAGLLTQFLPRKPVEGRSAIENNPLLARFQAGTYADNSEFKSQLQQLEREAADEQLARHRQAVNLMDADKKAPLDKILDKAPKDEKLMRHIIDLYVAKENGVTAQERQLLALPTKQRAAYIANQIQGLSPEKKNEAILNFARKRILTEDVFQQMPDVIEKSKQ